MTCKNCGKEIPEGAKACVYCGASVLSTKSGFEKIQPVETLKATWKKVQEHMKALVIIEALFLVPGLVWFLLYSTGSVSEWLATETGGALITAVCIIGVYGVLRLLALIGQVYVVGSNTNDAKAALKYSLKRFFPVIGYVALLSLLVLPLLVLVVLPVLVGFGLFPNLIGFAALAPYAFLLAIPVYAYFSTRLAFTVPLSVLNESSGSKLAQSWKLTDSYAWQVFKAVFTVGFLVLLVQLPFDLLSDVLPLVAAEIVAMVVQSAVQIFSIVFIVVLLREVQQKRGTVIK